MLNVVAVPPEYFLVKMSHNWLNSASGQTMLEEHYILYLYPQALDPIPTFNRGLVGAPGCAVSEDQESLDPTTVGGGDSTSAGSQTALAGANPSGGYTSFPVDVIVYFHMQVIFIVISFHHFPWILPGGLQEPDLCHAPKK